MSDTMLLTVLYRETSDLNVSLVIRGHNAPEMTLTTIYESITGVVAHDSAGDKESRAYTVQDNESITVLARRGGEIVACAIFQVETRHLDEGYVLRPVALCNALVDQCDETLIANATGRALAATNGVALVSPLLDDVDRIVAEALAGEVQR